MSEGDVMKEAKLINNELLVIEVPQILSVEQRQRMGEIFAKMGLPYKVLILDGGARVSSVTQLDRIETKLDQLISSLDDDGSPKQDLDGKSLPVIERREESL